MSRAYVNYIVITNDGGGVSYWMWKLIRSLKNSVFSSSQKVWQLEFYGRKLCLRILYIDGNDSETSDDVFDKCIELFNKLELDIPEACINRVHRMKIPGRVRRIIVRFTTWCHHSMVYRKRKIVSIAGSLLT